MQMKRMRNSLLVSRFPKRIHHVMFVRMCLVDAACIARDRYCASASIEINGYVFEDSLLSNVQKRLCGMSPYEENER